MIKNISLHFIHNEKDDAIKAMQSVILYKNAINFINENAKFCTRTQNVFEVIQTLKKNIRLFLFRKDVKHIDLLSEPQVVSLIVNSLKDKN